LAEQLDEGNPSEASHHPAPPEWTSGEDPAQALEERTQLLVRARKALQQEILKRHRAETRLTFEGVITRILSESRNFQTAFPSLVKALALSGQWDATEYWLLDRAAHVLRWGGLWKRDSSTLPEYEVQLKDTVWAVGEGVPGRTWEEMRGLWFESIAEEPTFPAPLASSGLRSALSLPFDGGEGTQGVLVFYSRGVRAHHEDDLETLRRALQLTFRLGRWKWGTSSPETWTLPGLGQTLVESLPMPAILVAPSGRIEVANAAARNLGMGGDPLLTLEQYRVAVQAQVAGVGTAYPLERWPAWRALRGEPSQAGDIEIRLNGKSVYLESYGAPITQEDGRILGALAIFIDVTTIRQQTQDLQLAKQRAQEADQAKTEFLSRMSHEIRTPLNAIMGMIDLLWETSLTQDQQEYVRICRNAGQNLMSLINDILDLSRVESGQFEFAVTGFELKEFMDKTIDLFALRAHQKGLELSYYIEPGVPEQLVGDPVRLRQILANLLSNAVKFTPKGHIIVYVRKDPEHPEPGGLLFSVEDTGIGIPPDRQEAIFDRFTQASPAVATQYGGSGLGLTIVKRLVELMGGNIWVKSSPGEGSTFTFRLRLNVPPDVTYHVAIYELKDIPVMLGDSDEENRQKLFEMLTPQGARVTTCTSGRELVARVRQARQAGDPYRLIFLGSNFADISTWDILEDLVRYGTPNAIILMLEPDELRRNLPRLRELGITNYVTKPVSGSAIMATAMASIQSQNLRREPVTRRQTTAAVPTPNLKGLRILLVEDSEDNRFLIQRYLRNTSCRLDLAENGKVAVDKFKANEYDLVLMDLQMPFLDGFEATRMIRDWERSRQLRPTPIVALSAYAIKEEIERSISAGCDAHITKPVEKSKLFEILTQFGQGKVPA